MLKRNVVIAMLLLALNNITYAQIADVTGIGEDSDSALRDANVMQWRRLSVHILTPKP